MKLRDNYQSVVHATYVIRIKEDIIRQRPELQKQITFENDSEDGTLCVWSSEPAASTGLLAALRSESSVSKVMPTSLFDIMIFKRLKEVFKI